MAHRALRPMKWGTPQGTVKLKTDDELPDAHLVSQRVLDRLYRRGWITDTNGFQYNRRHETHGQAGPAAVPGRQNRSPEPSPPEAKETKQEDPPEDMKAELGKLSRDELNAFASECGVEDPDKLRTKSDVVEAILATEAAE